MRYAFFCVRLDVQSTHGMASQKDTGAGCLFYSRLPCYTRLCSPESARLKTAQGPLNAIKAL